MKPTVSTPIATDGGELRRPATPPVKSATPRVAAAPMAAAGESSELSQTMLAGATGGAGLEGPAPRRIPL